MLYSNKNKTGLENLTALASSVNQIKSLVLQHKLGKQEFLSDMNKAFESVTKVITEAARDYPKALELRGRESTKAMHETEDAIKSIEDLVKKTLAFL